MKNKEVLEVFFQSWASFKKEVLRPLKDQEPNVQPKNHIVFESPATFRKFMTMQKIELLSVIAAKKPASIYELAKLLDRDFAAVLRDCTSLANTGFIKLKEMKDSRGTKTPVLAFAYTCILIHLPQRASYQIQFSEAA